MKQISCVKFGLVFLFLLFSQSFAFAGDCDGQTTYDDPADCETACTAANFQCVTDDPLDPVLFCCVDMTAVPELPSWFGPFFLASLVAGWEYWRTQRRKTASVKLVRRD